MKRFLILFISAMSVVTSAQGEIRPIELPSFVSDTIRDINNRARVRRIDSLMIFARTDRQETTSYYGTTIVECGDGKGKAKTHFIYSAQHSSVEKLLSFVDGRGAKQLEAFLRIIQEAAYGCGAYPERFVEVGLPRQKDYMELTFTEVTRTRFEALK